MSIPLPPSVDDPRGRSFWLAEVDELDTLCSTPELPAEADVVVVGAGLTGCSAALRCCESKRSVVLLEGRGVCWGSTGRNGGHIWPALNPAMSRKEFEARGVARSAPESLQSFLQKHGTGEEVEFPGSCELACSASDMA
eukprot:788958-Rhodomonas_salina.1